MPGGSPDPAEEQPQQPSLIDRFGGMLVDALPAIAGAIGFVGFIAVIGGAIQWFRFFAAELPADQAVHVIPRAELVTIGAVSTALFTLLGLIALLLVYLLDRRGDASPGTRRGLLIIACAELASVALIIDLRPGEYVLLVVWAVALAVLAYEPVERAAAALGPRLARIRDEQDFSSEQARWEQAQEAYREAQSAWEAVLRTQPAPDELRPYRRAYRRAYVTYETARVRWDHVTDVHRGHEHAVPPGSWIGRLVDRLKELTWKDLRAAVVFIVGLGVLYSYEETRWLIRVLPVPVLLFFALLGIARVTKRFAWYGVAVFLSVTLYGGVLAVADALHTPRVQPIAVVRKSDDHAMCGVYITQTADRLYIGRVEHDEDTRHAASRDTGRIFSIPMSDVDVASIGALQTLPVAEERAKELLGEVYLDRAEEAAPEVKNTVTVVAKQSETKPDAKKKPGDKITETTTTTTESPVRSGRPSRRRAPQDHPPEGCAFADLDG